MHAVWSRWSPFKLAVTEAERSNQPPVQSQKKMSNQSSGDEDENKHLEISSWCDILLEYMFPRELVVCLSLVWL